MSIATDEAEKKYILPNNHGAPAFDLYWLKDQQQQSYVAGRIAEPTFAEADELVDDLLVLGISLKFDDAMKILRNLRKVVME